MAVSLGGHPELVATIVGANPVLTCLPALFLFNEKLGTRQAIGVTVTIVGLLALRLMVHWELP